MRDSLILRYAGPDVDDGRMDAYDAAASIMGFADFLGVATKASYGPNARIQTEVHAFRQGSFAIEFAVHLGAIATISDNQRKACGLRWAIRCMLRGCCS